MFDWVLPSASTRRSPACYSALKPRRLQNISNANFDPLIAYLVPGATVLLGASPFSDTIRSWLATTPAEAPTIGGFLYLAIASLAVGIPPHPRARRDTLLGIPLLARKQVSRRNRLTVKPRPVLRQLAPHLAHARSAEPKPLGGFVRSFAKHQLLRQPAITFR